MKFIKRRSLIIGAPAIIGATAIGLRPALAATPTFSWNNYSDNTTGSSGTSVNVGTDRAAVAAGTINSGDILIAGITLYNPGSAVTLTPNTGTWTQIGSNLYDSGNTVSTAFFWHKAGVGETASYNFSWTGSLFAQWSLADYVGANSVSPIDTSQSVFDNGGTGSIVTPTLTLTNASDLVVTMFEMVQLVGGTTCSFPGGMTVRQAATNQFSSNAFTALADEAPGSSGSYTRTITVSSGRNYSYTQVALAPGGGGGGISGSLQMMGVGQ